MPCIVDQAIKTANMVGLKEKDNLLRHVFAYLSRVDYKILSTPELVGEIFSLLKQETGNDDPYKETRAHYNNMFLEQLPELEQEINASADPFLESIKLFFLLMTKCKVIADDIGVPEMRLVCMKN